MTFNEIAQLEKTRINLTSMDLESILKVVDNMRISQEGYEKGQQLAQRIVDDRKKLFWYAVIFGVVVIGGAIIWGRRIRRSLTGNAGRSD